MEKHDVVIIGGGPAGLSAAIYCGRAQLDTVILEKMAPGGQMATTTEIDNYPGFPNGADAVSLAMDMSAQAERFGVKTQYKTVTDFYKKGAETVLVTDRGEEIEAKVVILAMGAEARELGVKGEREFRGRGVSYCATCDGAFFKGKTVAVVGGGDTAAVDAVFLSKICEKVYLIHRRDTLRAAKIYTSKLEGKVDFLWDSVVTEISGGEKVNQITVKHVKSGEEKQVQVDGIFIAVGITPSTQWLKGKVDLDEGGFIRAGESTETSVPGVFVAGDCRTKLLRQVITAASDGAVSAVMAEKYIEEHEF